VARRAGNNELSVVFSLGLQLLPPAYPIDACPANVERLAVGRGAEALGFQRQYFLPFAVAAGCLHKPTGLT
jgi:hypothetical protein